MTIKNKRNKFAIVLLIIVVTHASASQTKIPELYRDISYGKHSSAIKQLADLPDRYINYPISKYKGQTLLHLASTNESRDNTPTLSLVAALLKKGADVNRPDDKGESPIFCVGRLRSSNLAVLDLLVKNGADINKVDFKGNAPLHRYIKSNKAELIKMAIALGANINAANSKGVTPFMYAAENRLGLMELMSSYDVNIHAVDRDGNTALHYAMKHGDLDTIDYLLGKGLKINEQNNRGETALGILAAHSKWAAVRILLERGADPHVPFRRDHSVAYYLITRPELGLSELIDKSKINVNKKMESGIPPLFKAISAVDLRLLEQLIDLGVDVNQSYAPNYPTIPFIAEKDPEKYKDAIPMLKRLIELGADVNAKNMGRGKTGLHVAAQRGYTKVVDILLEHGAVVDNKVVSNTVFYGNYGIATRMLKQKYKHKLDMNAATMWNMIDGMVDRIEGKFHKNDIAQIEEFITQLFAHKPVINLKKQNATYISEVRKHLENSSSVAVLNAIAQARFIKNVPPDSSRKSRVSSLITEQSDIKPVTIPLRTYSQAADLHVIGIYEGINEKNGSKPWWSNCVTDSAKPPNEKEMIECHKKFAGQHPEQKVKVRVTANSNPVILTLMSYEPIQWIVEKGNGVNIEAVILAGYYGQRISGISSVVPVDVYTYHHSDCNNCQVRDGYFYAYNRQDKKFNKAMHRLKTITKYNPVSFQGRYTGKSFAVVNSH